MTLKFSASRVGIVQFKQKVDAKMAGGARLSVLFAVVWIYIVDLCSGQVLTPPTFNLAKGRTITATATCGLGVAKPELYCKLTGAKTIDENPVDDDEFVIQGQICSYCDPSQPRLNHSADHAIDGSSNWWQSPPLSRGDEFNKVNLTIDLEQEFHIAYVIIKMANSPRPGVWVLEKSSDYGETWQPWQYFADTPNDCVRFFQTEARIYPTRDDDVICVTEFSRIVPLNDGEIFVSLVNGRPNANNFSYADDLKDFIKATNVRLRLIRTKNLLGHLMAVANQDPTVTRRYYYSIKDISLGGRCVCNGHADNCNYLDPNQPDKLICDCQHNTVGDQCNMCDAANGFVQKKWQPARSYPAFECEPCECYGRATECEYDPEVDAQGLSIDIHGFYSGGGVCQNCAYNSTGVNCEKCMPGYYKPYGVPRSRLDMCERCQCDLHYHLDECEDDTGRCLCREEYTGLNCDSCAVGYYGYPDCIPCDCDINGTEGEVCHVNGACGCDQIGSVDDYCAVEEGQCRCRSNYGSRNCSECADGYFNFPDCALCNCDLAGTEPDICDKVTACKCDQYGSRGASCDQETGQCDCFSNFQGLMCERCKEGLYNFPNCEECNCNPDGARQVPGYPLGGCGEVNIGRLCECKERVVGRICDMCKQRFWNLNRNNPLGCEECGCSPVGTIASMNRCDMGTGQCVCKVSVTGRVCDRCREECKCDIGGPLQQHFIPSLDQFKYEIEDGYVPEGYGVRYGHDERIFPNFSWRGYATMSRLQPEVWVDIKINKPSLYRLLFHYVNLNEQSVNGEIILNPKSPRETQQTSDIAFAPSQQPAFTDAGNLGGLNNFVLNPGEWTVQIKTENSIFLDYMILIPQAYYEATILQNTDSFNLDLNIPKKDRYVLVLNYYSQGNGTQSVGFNISTTGDQAAAILYKCQYSSLCRQVLLGYDEMEAIFDFEEGVIHIGVLGDENESIVAIPYSVWSMGYIRPSIVCIRINGECVQSRYATPVGSVRIDFEELPNDHLITDVYPPGVSDTDIGLIQLNRTQNLIVLLGQARNPGPNKFIVHYYLPYSDGQEIQITMFANGQEYKGTFTPRFCPSEQGCRDVIFFDETAYTGVLNLQDTNVKIVFNNTSGQQIWLDYLLIIPSEKYSPTDILILPVDNSRNFIDTCLDEGYKIRTPISDFCEKSLFSLTTEFNNGALECECDIDGSLSFQCDANGGQCPCRPNECQCNSNGVMDGDMNCEQDSGQCRCRPGIGGRKCDYCIAGFYSFPYCQECDCDYDGTMDEICDPANGACICKDNVIGPRCDTCGLNTYNLEPTNPLGCSSCFCFGNTANCRESDLYWEPHMDMLGWGVTNTLDGEVYESRTTIAVLEALDKIDQTNMSMYWMAPESYLGNKVLSYGGFLQYTLIFVLPRNETIATEALIEPDLVLVGNHGDRVEHTAVIQPYDSSSTQMSVQLYEYNFRYPDGKPVDREAFMMILENLGAMHIRGSYYSLVDEIRLMEVELDVASENGTGERAISVEQCQCPRGYSGASCEDCADGYYRARNYPFLGTCVPCDCNGHADSCDLSTGVCIDCHDNTMGDHCEQCLPGYYDDPYRSGCSICGCPLQVDSNNFADQCRVSSDNILQRCECFDGYTGDRCERCGPGHYGNPMTIGETCELCQCSGNIDRRDPYSCDHLTGECLRCENNTTGPQCERVTDVYHADARKQRSQANVILTTAHVRVNRACVETVCDCEFDGAVTCDPVDGRCQCLPGVTGSKCEQCLDRWVLIPQEGCQECDTCIDNLLDDLEVLEVDVESVKGGLETVSIGVEAMKRLDRANASIFTLQPQVNSVLYESENITLEPVSLELQQMELYSNTIRTRSEAAIADAEDLVDEAAISYINGVLQQINEGIKVTNIETYITLSERIIGELEARNFTGQNDTLASDIEEAEMLLEGVKALQLTPQNQATFRDTVSDDIDEVNRRLLDLQVNSEDSEATTTKAKSILAELILNTNPKIEMSVDEILLGEDLTQESLEESMQQLNDSQNNLDMAAEELQNLSRVSSMLMQGRAALKQFTDIYSDLDQSEIYVNQTADHADMLNEQAAILETVYTDTRAIASNAVAAGRAYENIVKAINDASDAANVTFDNADSAAVDSNGVGELSKNFTMSSEELLIEAKLRFNATQVDLLDRLDSAKAGTMVVEGLNKEVSIAGNQIKQRLLTIPVGEVGQKANDVSANGEAAGQRAEDAKVKVKDILKDLPKQLEKTVPLTNDALNTKRDIVQARAQVNTVQKFIPNIQTLLTDLTAESERVMVLGQQVKTNIAALKEKIAIARNQANLIRVGLNFLGNTTVELRNPRNVAQAGSYSDVSLFFKTTDENGLLLYAGSEMSGSKKPNQDFMSIEIENGNAVFKYNLDSGLVKINHPHYVSDGQWYKVTAKRIGKAGTLLLEQDQNKPELPPVMGVARGSNTVLDLHPLTTKFYSGGLPEEATMISEDVTRDTYVGIIEDIKFDDNPMGVWNFKEGNNNYKGARERDILTSVVSNGFRFDGAGFVILSTSQTGWKPAVKSQVSMKFKTYAPNGLLFFAGEDRDFISIELRDGKVLHQYDLGGGRVQLEYKFKEVNDGEWHDVQINRRNKTGMLFVDGDGIGPVDSPGSLTQLSITDEISIGGYSGIILPVSLLDSQCRWFKGKYRFLEMNIDDYETVRTRGTDGFTSVDTTSPLYFGNADINVPTELANSQEQFGGCIGDVTINGQFLNFAVLQPTQRPNIALAGCPIPDPEGPYNRDPLPTLYPPTEPPSTTEAPTMPPGQCALTPVEPQELPEESRKGFYFGAYPGSRLEYESLPSLLRIRGVITLDFKTSAENGVLLYFADTKHIDFISITLQNGMLRFAFDCGSGSGEIISEGKVNDGKWHSVTAARNFKEGALQVDGIEVGIMSSGGRSRSLNVKAPYYIGGVNTSLVIDKGLKNLNLWFTADNGAGSIIAKIQPEMNNKFCNGAWHSVIATKRRNVVTLSVDGADPVTATSSGTATSADTNNPIYLGGKPDTIMKGIRAQDDYMGCMRNLYINGESQFLATGVAFGDKMNVCKCQNKT
ncbi:LAMA-like protein [Mya arenaria]|uniref:LAMA-like protein n=1 Tax=Mya arenaria TaxID=6604 RepID=A0ABY7FV75_MYAAR|nr:LAMA-like protein [Mya arenaria]